MPADARWASTDAPEASGFDLIVWQRIPVSGFTDLWNDSDVPIDVLGVIAERRDTMINTIRRVLRRLDDWTLEVFNPRYPSDHR